MPHLLFVSLQRLSPACILHFPFCLFPLAMIPLSVCPHQVAKTDTVRAHKRSKEQTYFASSEGEFEFSVPTLNRHCLNHLACSFLKRPPLAWLAGWDYLGFLPSLTSPFFVAFWLASHLFLPSSTGVIHGPLIFSAPTFFTGDFKPGPALSSV